MDSIFMTQWDPIVFQSTARDEPSVRLYARNRSIIGERSFMRNCQAISDLIFTLEVTNTLHIFLYAFICESPMEMDLPNTQREQ
jgi:hypothetical protein